MADMYTKQTIKSREEKHEKLSLEKPLVQSVSDKEQFDFSFKTNRSRYKKFPDRLPTKGRFPFPPDEHKHIGLYENKQTLYLLIAHVYNRLMRRTNHLLDEIASLRAEIEALKSQTN